MPKYEYRALTVSYSFGDWGHHPEESWAAKRKDEKKALHGYEVRDSGESEPPGGGIGKWAAWQA